MAVSISQQQCTTGRSGAARTASVRDIVSQPQLRIEIVAGAAGLDAPVSWAHSSDLPDASAWLTGGEMVMRNGRTLPHGAVEQAALMDSLARAGACALLIGADDRTPRLTRMMTERADALRVPLLRVPFSIPFALIGRAVADHAVRPSDEVMRIARVYALIEDAVVRNDPARFVAELRRELDCQVFAVDVESGRNALPGTPSFPAASRRSLLAALGEHRGHVPALLRIQETASSEIAAITVPDEEATLLVLRQPVGRAVDMPLLQHAATAMAVAVAYASLSQEHEREMGTEILGQLLAGSLAGEAAERELRVRGVGVTRARLLAVSCGDVSQRQLYRRLRRNGVHHVLGRRHGILYLLVGTASVTTTLAIVERTVDGGVGVGVSDLVRSGNRTPEAAREALWSLAAARRTGGTVYYGSASAVPAIRDVNQAQALVDRVLGPLIERDRETGGELLDTLAAYLECRRSWVNTAQALHVHRQTVIYRVKQIERITKRDVGSTADIAELWLALAARDAMHGRGPSLAKAASGTDVETVQQARRS